jgi:hypothetical protein
MSYEIVGKFINSYICDVDKVTCLIIIIIKRVLLWLARKY